MTVFAFTLNSQFQIEGVFDQFNSLEWERNFFIPNGIFRLEANLNQVNAASLAIGRFIGVTDDPKTRVIDRLLRIEQIEFKQDETSAAGEILKVVGRDIGGMFQERLIVPPAGQDFDQITGSTETVMKHYVNSHAGPGAETGRQIPGLVIATDEGRGINLTVQGRFQTISELLQTISFRTNIGWEVTFDVGDQNHIFDIIVGTDRSITSDTPILLDLEFQSIRDLILLKNDLETKTFAFIGGQGDGADRIIIKRSIAIGQTQPSVFQFPIEFPIQFSDGSSDVAGFNRKEIFVDAQNVSGIGMLNLSGDSALVESQQDDIVEARLTRLGPFVYRRDWDLGDIITVRNKKWGLQKDMRIVRVKTIIRPGTGTVENLIGLDRPFPNLKDRIIEQFKKMDAGRRI